MSVTIVKNRVKDILSKYLLADGYNLVMDVKKSHNNYIVDKLTGDSYLDMFTMFASASIGYNHPHLLKESNKIGKLALTKPTLSDVYTEEYAEFLETFNRVAIPESLSYTFFIEGGTLAVENCLKAAFDWKTRKNIANGLQQEADIVIHFKQAFHGRSGYTLSLTNTHDPKKYIYFPKFNWPRITNPKLTFPITDENLRDTINDENTAKKEIENAFSTYGNRVACIIIEPIQGEGGDNFFRNEFHHYLRQICNAKEALLIYDEVQCGMGITGKMWAFEHYNVLPDLLAFGKKTQVCGLLANKKKFDEVEHHVFVENSRINSTFGGNYVDFLRFKLILEVIEKENLIENAKINGKYLLNKILEFQTNFSNEIINVRGLGLWCSFDFVNPKIRSPFISRCFKNKLILLPCGAKSIRFRPHLNVTKEFIDDCFVILTKSLKEIL